MKIKINELKLEEIIKKYSTQSGKAEKKINKIETEIHSEDFVGTRETRLKMAIERNMLSQKKVYFDTIVSSIIQFKNGEESKTNGYLYWEEDFFTMYYNNILNNMNKIKSEDMNLERMLISEPFRDIKEKYKKNIVKSKYKGFEKAINIINSIIKKENSHSKYNDLKRRLKPVFAKYGLTLHTIVPIKKENQRIDSRNVNLVFDNNFKIKFPSKIEGGMPNALFNCLEKNNFGYITNYLLKNIKNPKMTKFLKKVEKEIGADIQPFFARVELTTKGYYFVLSAYNIQQPLMLDWNGKVLDKKQGQLISVIHASF